MDVTLARKKNASAITIAAAIAVASTVSVLTVRPNHLAVSWWPTSMAASARMCLGHDVVSLPSPFGSLRSAFITGRAVVSTSST